MALFQSAPPWRGAEWILSSAAETTAATAASSAAAATGSTAATAAEAATACATAASAGVHRRRCIGTVIIGVHVGIVTVIAETSRRSCRSPVVTVLVSFIGTCSLTVATIAAVVSTFGNRSTRTSYCSVVAGTSHPVAGIMTYAAWNIPCSTIVSVSPTVIGVAPAIIAIVPGIVNAIVAIVPG